MARFYGNENLPLPVVEHLRNLGHDVLTSKDAGNANRRIPDEDVLEFAKETGRAVLTLNRVDFVRLHRKVSGIHAGIVTCTEDSDFVALADRVHDVISTLTNLDGVLVRITKTGHSIDPQPNDLPQ
ncbi:DUF5615 family PIN-like protein [Fimbriimonas ginsengisoli]|uniref:DUF5615 domain-containing protein n=1 Tax=Fimbriimonas ginsengisoli Gsoil 348 TaxID=661478 RepID=A0A068NJ44_FIMGI|nr:DUF5615 family PIN-like protein [Fimbriimonas ginsengisoli]AIE83482.1 hypothetical protein OP10G_0114 [Fimbriimonas ginsengisoli Gsoil 348]